MRSGGLIEQSPPVYIKCSNPKQLVGRLPTIDSTSPCMPSNAPRAGPRRRYRLNGLSTRRGHLHVTDIQERIDHLGGEGFHANRKLIRQHTHDRHWTANANMQVVSR